MPIYATLRAGATRELPWIPSQPGQDLVPPRQHVWPRMAGAETRRATIRRRALLVLNTKTGRWADFATGERGGDVVSLAAFIFGTSQTEAARTLAADSGCAQLNGPCKRAIPPDLRCDWIKHYARAHPHFPGRLGFVRRGNVGALIQRRRCYRFLLWCRRRRGKACRP